MVFLHLQFTLKCWRSTIHPEMLAVCPNETMADNTWKRYDRQPSVYCPLTLLVLYLQAPELTSCRRTSRCPNHAAHNTGLMPYCDTQTRSTVSNSRYIFNCVVITGISY